MPSTRSIVILATNPKRFLGLEHFLGERGWVIRTRRDVKSFTDAVVQLRPSFVMISSDVESEELLACRERIKRLSGTKVIVFSETQSAASLARLKQTPADYRVTEPLNGPALDRIFGIERPKLKVVPTLNRQVMRQGCKQVMAALFQPHAESKRSVELPSRILCVQVKSSTMNGIFVIAGAGEMDFTDRTFAEFESEIRDFVAQKVHGVESDRFEMELSLVPFQSWAQRAAAFVEYASHQSSEIAIAFFPAPESLFQLRESARADLIAMSLEDLATSKRSAFDIYLHLPLNGKFVLYVSQGSMVEAAQKEQLRQKGIQYLHVPKSSAREILRTRVVRAINRSISTFLDAQAA